MTWLQRHFFICLDVVNPIIIWRHYKLVLATFLWRCGSDQNKASLPRQFSDHDITILPPAPWYKYFIISGLHHQNITHCHKRAIPKPIYIVKIKWHHFYITPVMQDGHSAAGFVSIITLYISRVLTIVTAIPQTHRIQKGNCCICLQ